MLDKIMVACPFSYRKDYCIEDYFNNVKNFTYPNIEYYFVDNSFDPSYHLKLMAKYGFEIDYVSPKYLPSTIYMCSSMKKIRDRFLKSDCTHLLLNECDVFPPIDVIEQLLAHDKLIVGCPYFIGFGDNMKLEQFNIDRAWGKYTSVNVTDYRKDFLQHTGELKRKDTIGFGCILIKKQVLEDYTFYPDVLNKVHCDSTFAMDMFDKGIDILCDEYILCTHRNHDWSSVTDF